MTFMWRHCNVLSVEDMWSSHSGILLCMGLANETQHYNVTWLSHIGWAHSQNDPCTWTDFLPKCHYITQLPLHGSYVSFTPYIWSFLPMGNYLDDSPRTCKYTANLSDIFLNSVSLRYVEVILQVYFPNQFHELIYWVLPLKLVTGECHTNCLMMK